LDDTIIQEGIVTDARGLPLEDAHDVRVRLWDRVAGGMPLFDERHADVEFIGGWYAIAVGSERDLDPAIFRRPGVWLTISVDGGADLLPRIALGKVPAAFVADDAVGDIHPRTVSIGENTVINENGLWVGDPTGLRGPAGPAGAAGPQGPEGPAGAAGGQGSPDTPAQVRAKLMQVDGAGSGVDADLLDGSQANAFVRTAAEVLQRLLTVDGADSGLDADRLDGHDSGAFIRTGAQLLALLRGVDGADSGIDADRLDGHDSSVFVRTAAQILNLLRGVDGADSGLDADRLDGHDSSVFARTPAQVVALLRAGDGAGSGVDADLLDGQDSSRFMRVDRNTGTSGVLTAERIDIHPGEIAGGRRAWMVDGVRIGAGGSDNAYFGLKDEGNNNADTVVAWGDDVGDHLRFIFARSGGAVNGEEYMRVTSEGRVGVGKTNPAHRLDVNGTIGANSIQLTPSARPPANPAVGTVYMDEETLGLLVWTGEEWSRLTDPVQSDGPYLSYGMWQNLNNGADATTALPISVRHTKLERNSKLRVTFSSNLRTNGGGGSCCRWGLRVNGRQCTPQPVNGNVYISPGGNYHQHRTINGICTGVPEGDVTVVPWVERCPGYGNHDCYTGWQSMTSLIVEEIPEDEPMSFGAWNNRSSGADATSALPHAVVYDKQDAASWLEVVYTTNMRTHGGGGRCCRWAMRVNGAQCSTPLNANVYISPGGNYHQVRTLGGLCSGVGRGRITVQPWIERCPGYGNADCHTGWNSATSLMVRERPRERIAYGAWQNINRGEDATRRVPGVALDYDKQEDDSLLRLTFASNLRTHGGGGRCCRWAIRVDGQQCREPINGNVYISPGGNYHHHRTITGMCEGVRRGRHRIEPWLEQCPGYGNADCYTGWQSTTTLLVEEGPF